VTDDPPALDAYRSNLDRQLEVWCEHDRRWHLHGRHVPGRCPLPEFPGARQKCTCPVGTGDGHRVAHCTCRNSPYIGRGYVLREVGPLTAEVKRGRRDSRAVDCPTCRKR